MALAIRDGAQLFRIRVSAGALDLARGHDGFLRGHPEPVLLVGLYRCHGGDADMLGRTVIHFERVARVPGEIAPVAGRDGFATEGYIANGGALAVLVVALEEDRGRDIASLYAELIEAGEILLWASDAGEAVPAPLAELPHHGAEGELAAVELKIAGRFPRDWFRADDYIAAAAAWLTPNRGRLRLRARLRSEASREARNDWLAELEIRIR